jgi:uncharacterized membrane protein HdeD (DUF308 family)
MDNATPIEEPEAAVQDVASNLAAYWQLFVLRGLVVTAFGLFFLVHPGSTIDVLAKVFGSLFIIEGAANLIKVFVVCCCTDSQSMLCVYFLSFVCNTAVGILVIVHPDETANVLLIFIAAWFVAIGFLQIIMACLFQVGNISGPACLIGSVGMLYFILGIFLLTNLDEGVRTIVRIIGAVVSIFGLQLVYLGMKLKTMTPEPIPEYNSSEYSSIMNNTGEEEDKDGAVVSSVV